MTLLNIFVALSARVPIANRCRNLQAQIWPTFAEIHLRLQRGFSHWECGGSILQGQPTGSTAGDFAVSKLRNARQWLAFANRLAVSGLRNWPLWERNRR